MLYEVGGSAIRYYKNWGENNFKCPRHLFSRYENDCIVALYLYFQFSDASFKDRNHAVLSISDLRISNIVFSILRCPWQFCTIFLISPYYFC